MNDTEVKIVVRTKSKIDFLKFFKDLTTFTANHDVIMLVSDIDFSAVDK